MLSPLPPLPHPRLRYTPPTPAPLLTSQIHGHRTACTGNTQHPTGAPCWPLTPTPQLLLHRTCAGLTPTACCQRTPSPRPASMFQKERRTQSECVGLRFPSSGGKRNLNKVWKSGFRAIRKHQGSFGEIHLTIRFATLRNKLIIVVDACRFLMNLS